ncbi:MAG: spermidine/putrescine transport system substrate-binding protein [Parasphingorhabdus sp.]|jgi:spermidine/putrescine transport system substrate-binding protein
MYRSSRRNFLQQGSALAVAAAAGTFPGLSYGARDKELNIYCWEGYNSDNVVDPFRREFDAKVRTEALTGDPDAVNRLRAGETKIWDLINVNNPWARNVMWPEGLIRALPKDRFEPYYEKMLPAFHPPYNWAYDQSGENLLGMVQRFGTFNFAIDTNKISIATAEDEGFNLFLDPAMKGRYGMLAYDDWNIAHMCITAGVDPYKKHTREEIDAYAKMAKIIIDGAKVISDDLAQLNLAVINDEIDAYFSGGTYSVSSARHDGALNLYGVTPKTGPMNGKGGITWIEVTSVVNNPDVSPLAEEFLAYVQRPEVSKHVAFAEGTYNPVSNMGDPKVLAAFTKEELQTIQWDTLEEELTRCADYNINPDLAEMHEIYLAARRDKA